MRRERPRGRPIGRRRATRTPAGVYIQPDMSPELSRWSRLCSRQSGREGDAASRYRVASGAAGRHQAAQRRRHQLGGQPRRRDQAGDDADAVQHLRYAQRRRQHSGRL